MFEVEDWIKKLNVLKLTTIIRYKVGKVKYVRILKVGHILVGCSNEEQVGKSTKLTSNSTVKVGKVANYFRK